MSINTPNANALSIIRNLECFSALSDRQLKKIVKRLIPRNFAKNDRIIKKGDLGLGLYVIVSGRVEVYSQVGEERISIAEVGPGECLGEMSIFDKEPRSANAIALEDCECLFLTEDSFDGLVKREPEILRSIVPILVRRIRTASAMQKNMPVSEPCSESKDAREEDEEITGNPFSESDKFVEAGDQDLAGFVSKKNDVETALQLGSSAFSLTCSMLTLAFQESIQLTRGEGSFRQRVKHSEEAIESVTNTIDEQIDKRGKRVQDAFGELAQSVAGLFEK